MVGKIELVDEQDHNSYVLKIYPDTNKQPKFLFHCSYIDRSKEEALAEAQKFRKEFSKIYNIPLEKGLES